MSIKINNISFKYNKYSNDVLKNISFTVDSGKICVILGLNGSGKTTLVKTIAGIYKADEGNININDNDVNLLSINEKSKLFSYVSQKVNNLTDILVREYLLFGMVNTLKFYQKPSKEQYEKVEDIANKFGISALLDKAINEISGGERQIISLCCALLQNTEIILLDEPTSALDLKNQNLVLNALKTLSSDENKTIILTSHHPNHALFLDSDVALIKDGKLLKYGHSSDIINKEVLREVYGDNICMSKDLAYQEVSFK